MDDKGFDIPGAVRALFDGIGGLIDRLMAIDPKDPVFWILAIVLVGVAWNLSRRR